MGDDEPQWTLLHVTRHPAWPEMDRLGSGTTQEALADLIADALATTWDGVFGSGPEWLEIFAYHDAVLAGTKRFAQAKSDEDWRAQADELMTYAYHPWARVFEHPAPDSSPWADDADPIACWLEAITSEAVITGHKIYMRSAWEGAKGFRDSDWDPARAQSVADAIIRDAGKRVRADWAFLQSLRSSNVNVTST